ncbi:hypothetical protein M514_11562 [Trichuris suis]|uniref:Uncharacterized protein n=1 Tax=Trichuris suis TaxID=68888 RepID=A0A085LRG5_9BILA|nr:hypothetical protein M513_11562 [Trichuris suis]KFD69050.1 hypothetical protein M514_11562 [Trichuris suis]
MGGLFGSVGRLKGQLVGRLCKFANSNQTNNLSEPTFPFLNVDARDYAMNIIDSNEEMKVDELDNLNAIAMSRYATTPTYANCLFTL